MHLNQIPRNFLIDLVMESGFFVVHGGLFRNPDGSVGSIRDLQGVDRNDKDPEREPLLDLLWSDPQETFGMYDNYMRGCATFFGPDVTQEFLEKHGLSLMIRSHEGPDAREKRPHLVNDMMEGYAIDHRDENNTPILITVFSAPNYPQGPQSRGNTASFIRFPNKTIERLIYEIRQFQAAPRPEYFSVSFRE